MSWRNSDIDLSSCVAEEYCNIACVAESLNEYEFSHTSLYTKNYFWILIIYNLYVM